MGDVAQILGIKREAPAVVDGINALWNNTNSNKKPRTARKAIQLSKDTVTDLLPKNTIDNSNNDINELPPIVPTTNPRLLKERIRQQQQQQQVAGKAEASSGVAGTTSATGPKSAGTKRYGKSKSLPSNEPAKPWVYAPFCSSSRTDGLILYHWVRANVEYPDYPYARFDIHLDPVVYTDEEYKLYLDPLSTSTTNKETNPGINATNSTDSTTKSSTTTPTTPGVGSPTPKDSSSLDEFQFKPWTRGETDCLMDICKRYELRWPVIHDRWIEEAGTLRRVEELQHRYYSVAAILMQYRIAKEAVNEVQALNAAIEQSNNQATAAAGDASGTGGGSSSQTGATGAPLTQQQQQQQQQQTASLLIEAAAARSLALNDPATQPLFTDLGTGATNKAFDLVYETKRRQHYEQLWYRTKEEEEEEIALRQELKGIEAQLRKLKKVGAHTMKPTSKSSPSSSSSPANINTTGAASSSTTKKGRRQSTHNDAATTATASGAAKDSSSAVPPSASALHQPALAQPSGMESVAPKTTSSNEANTEYTNTIFPSTIVTPVPGIPYLQSGRLVMPPTQSETVINMESLPNASTGTTTNPPPPINPSLLRRLETILEYELKIPPAKQLLPTKRVCDVYDTVRQDLLTLLVYQKHTLMIEGLIQSKRIQLQQLQQQQQQELKGGVTSPTTTGTPGATTPKPIDIDIPDEEIVMGIRPIPPVAMPAPPPPPAPVPKQTQQQPQPVALSPIPPSTKQQGLSKTSTATTSTSAIPPGPATGPVVTATTTGTAVPAATYPETAKPPSKKKKATPTNKASTDTTVAFDPTETGATTKKKSGTKKPKVAPAPAPGAPIPTPLPTTAMVPPGTTTGLEYTTGIPPTTGVGSSDGTIPTNPAPTTIPAATKKAASKKGTKASSGKGTMVQNPIVPSGTVPTTTTGGIPPPPTAATAVEPATSSKKPVAKKTSKKKADNPAPAPLMPPPTGVPTSTVPGSLSAPPAGATTGNAAAFVMNPAAPGAAPQQPGGGYSAPGIATPPATTSSVPPPVAGAGPTVAGTAIVPSPKPTPEKKKRPPKKKTPKAGENPS